MTDKVPEYLTTAQKKALQLFRKGHILKEYEPDKAYFISRFDGKYIEKIHQNVFLNIKNYGYCDQLILLENLKYKYYLLSEKGHVKLTELEKNKNGRLNKKKEG